MKRILIISPFFFPEPISTGKFNTELAIALQKAGHKVTILCFHPFYPSWKLKPTNQQLKRIKIIRGGRNIKFSNRTIIRRIVLELSFSFFVLRKVFSLRNSTDIIVPVFPPSLAFYTILPFLPKRILKVGMVHDLQEIYSNKKSGFVNSVVKKGIHFVEKKVYNVCERLVFLSEEMKETARELYGLDNTTLKVQYPFYTVNEKNITNDLTQIFVEGKQHIVYSGALGEKQNPKGLLEVFDYTLKKLNNTMFHIFSDGVAFEEIKNLNTNDSIKFHNLVPKKNIEELYKKSSLQIVPQLSGTSKGSLPSKLPNLLVSGCNVLCITDKGSEIEKLFKNNNFSTVVSTWNKQELAKIISSLLKQPANNLGNQVKKSKELFQINSMVNTILTE